MHSAVYAGTIRHRRFRPVENQFQYRIFFMYLDLDELDHVFDGHPFWSVERFNIASFRRSDHAGDPRVPLDRAVRELVRAETGERPAGPIRILTHLRYFGYCFNPVSFYYCYGRDGRTAGGGGGGGPKHAVARNPLLCLRECGQRAPGPGMAAVPVRQGLPRLAVHGHGHPV